MVNEREFNRVKEQVENHAERISVVEKTCCKDLCRENHEKITEHVQQIKTLFINQEKQETIIKDTRNEIDNVKDKYRETSDNLNILTDKVATLIKSTNDRIQIKRNIVAGIVITVVGAILIWAFQRIVSSIENKNNDAIQILKEEIQKMKHEK